MLRSPWFWLSVILIAAGVALTELLGVLRWLSLTIAVGVAIVDGVLLYHAYVIPPAKPPTLPQLRRSPGEEPVPVIHDCDVTMGRPFRNVDDGLALLHLLGEPRIDVQAVTTTYGDGSVSLTTRTTCKLLREIGCDGLPVIRGASGPDTNPEDNEAARFLVKHVSAQPQRMVLLASGAMTNLKHAEMLDPDFFRKLRSLHLVGGATGPIVWQERQLLERNFSVDPEAAYRAIQAECPTSITLGEAGLTAVFRSSQFAALQSLDDPVSNLIVKQTRLWFGLMRLWFRDDGFAMWAPIAATALTQPACLRMERAHLPVTVDDLRNGHLVVDPDRAGPVRLIHGVEKYDSFIEAQLGAWHHLGQSIGVSKKEGS